MYFVAQVVAYTPSLHIPAYESDYGSGLAVGPMHILNLGLNETKFNN